MAILFTCSKFKKHMLGCPWMKLASLNCSYLIHSKRLTHYEILGVEEKCSQDDIKKAFIRLSKELHPDKQHSDEDTKSNHSKFVLLNEAYSTLSKPTSRNHYDAELKVHPNGYTEKGGVHTNAPHEKVIFRDKSIWEHRDRKEDQHYQERTDYYGIPWINNKLSNSMVLMGVVLFMTVGMVGQYMAAQWWTSITQRRAEATTTKISKVYQELREKAKSSSDRSVLLKLHDDVRKRREN